MVIVAAGALLAVVGFIFGPLIRLALSRRRESLADASGVELTRNPAGLLSALKKLQQNDTAVQEDEPRHRGHVHRRPLAAPRGAGITASTTPTLPSRRGSPNSRSSRRVCRSDE